MAISLGVVRQVLDDIADGVFASTGELMAESELADRYGVSRLTVREATRNLADRGVLEVRQGRKSRIVPPQQWSAMDPELARVRMKLPGIGAQLVGDLMEMRSVLEIAAVEMAAQRMSEQEINQLRETLVVMESRTHEADPLPTTEADMSFHRIIVDAARNEYLRDAYAPLEDVLRVVRQRTSSSTEVRQDAVQWHRSVLDALVARSPELAVNAMRGHMQQTEDAIRQLPEMNPQPQPERHSRQASV